HVAGGGVAGGGVGVGGGQRLAQSDEAVQCDGIVRAGDGDNGRNEPTFEGFQLQQTTGTSAEGRRRERAGKPTKHETPCGLRAARAAARLSDHRCHTPGECRRGDKTKHEKVEKSGSGFSTLPTSKRRRRGDRYPRRSRLPRETSMPAAGPHRSSNASRRGGSAGSVTFRGTNRMERHGGRSLQKWLVGNALRRASCFPSRAAA